MGSVFGKNIKVSIFGESHGVAIGAVCDNFPSGIKLDLDMLRFEMDRRKPGGDFSTKRKENDEFQIVSGIVDGVTTGAPICVVIHNSDTHSKDYSKFFDTPRPSHSDYPAFVKFGGFNDIRGGGHFSARLTAPLVFVGSLCKQVLSEMGIGIFSHIYSVKDICDDEFSKLKNEDYETIKNKKFPVLNDIKGEEMKREIEKAREQLDSVGGIIECGVFGMPVGIGDPFFDSMESLISHMIFSIPAVKGIEFGAGFAVSKKYGSENNDTYILESDKIKTKTNNAGGINGGLSTGMPIIFKTAFKPIPSIYKEQETLNIKTKTLENLKIEGRHDPCVVVRAIPVVEAATAIAILDTIL
jgi:chorismate synthase